ncbi:MAG: hypothetical protein ACREME_06320 [Gemmatimonadales bacterium]
MSIRCACLLLAATCAALPTLAAQQAVAIPTPAPSASATAGAPADPPPQGLPPRVRPAFPRYEPEIRTDSTRATGAAVDDRTTITISTLALVAVGVVLLLLILD